MRESLKDFFEGVNIKKTIFLIIWTAGIIGWGYFFLTFPPILKQADWAYSEAIKIRQERIENKKEVGQSVGEYDGQSSTEKQDTPDQSAGEETSSLPAPGNIEKIIYEVAKEKKFKDPETLVRIAKAESSLNPCRKNPNSSAIGIFQILDMHGLSKADRCNPRIATAWAIDHFRNGHPWDSSRSKWE